MTDTNKPNEIGTFSDPDLAGSGEIALNDSGTCEKIDTPLTQRRSPSVPEWTYFIRDAEGIKIGRSIHPQSRLRNLQGGNGSRLELLVAVPSVRLSESDAHRKFKHLRTHREWFRPEQDLLDFIAALKTETQKPQRSARGNPLIGKLQALRKAHGPETPTGYACSNLMEQVPLMAGYVRPAWAQDERQTLPWMIEWQMKRLEAIKALSN